MPTPGQGARWYIDSGRIYEPYEARCADALHQMAFPALGADSAPDKATVVLHVDAQDLTASTGRAGAENGPDLLPETVLRFACDAGIRTAVEDEQRRPLGIGRVSRSIPLWLRRQVRRRDGGCVFPDPSLRCGPPLPEGQESGAPYRLASLGTSPVSSSRGRAHASLFHAPSPTQWGRWPKPPGLRSEGAVW